MQVKTNVSLCEKCANLDAKYTPIVRQACSDAGIECHCVWCAATDQPETEHWQTCVNYRSYENEQDMGVANEAVFKAVEV